jgi:hypothetical protein
MWIPSNLILRASLRENPISNSAVENIGLYEAGGITAIRTGRANKDSYCEGTTLGITPSLKYAM